MPSRPQAPKTGSKQQRRPAGVRMYLVPCSCGVTFAVSPEYDRGGSGLSRYLACPGCGKRHDPKNRLLEMGYQSEGYWTVDKC